MGKDDIKKLNELRQDLEIDERSFKILLALAVYYQKNSEQYISDEVLFQIIEETLVNIDYEEEDISGIKTKKNLAESFEKSLSNLGYDKIKRVK